MLQKQYYVYILASQKYGTLYIGMTRDLRKRVYEHREGGLKGFSKQYSVKKLVYYEIHEDVTQAILREKQLKKWNRDWKIKLIEETNLGWFDLYGGLI